MRAILLLPLTAIYLLVIRAWEIYWRIKKPIKLDAKVISIGNLTLGGSGKTTLTGYLAQTLLLQNKNVAIIARGYKRPAHGPVTIRHGDTVDWEKCGDEPALLARSIPGITVYIESDKTSAAQRAVADGFKLLIIDDGFQHRKLHRDIDIVCLDRHSPFGNGLLLPSGRLREPVSALKRADILVRIGNTDESIENRGKLPADIPVIDAQKTPSGLLPMRPNMPGKADGPVLAFCGLANPESFRRSLKEMGIEVAEFIKFSDHHIYTRSELEKIIGRGEKENVRAYVTTLKDTVKLERLWPSNSPLYYLRITIKLEREDYFLRLLNV